MTAVLAVPVVAPAHAGAAPEPAPAVTRQPENPPNPTVPARYLDQKLDWKLCSFDAEMKTRAPGLNDSMCAMLTVPMDWHHPDAHPDIQVAISYTKASGTSKGLLTANPGGPGGPGLDLPQWLATTKPRMAQEYDLVGFDPRGIGESTHSPCMTTTGELEALPRVVDPRTMTDEVFAADVARMRLLTDACAKSELAPFIGTQQTVYDMDLIRTVMKAEKLNFVGYSYGTWMGAWYADTFPNRVGRFMLDSNMAWTKDFPFNFSRDPMAFERRRDEMLFPWIARHDGEYGLGRTSIEVRAGYERIRAGLTRLAASGRDDVSPTTLDYGVAGAVYRDSRFPQAAEFIVSLKKLVETGEPLPAARRSNERHQPLLPPAIAWREKLRSATADASLDEPGPDTPVDIDAMSALIMCNDSTWTTDPGSYKAQWRVNGTLYPFLGYDYGIQPCAFWKHNGAGARSVDLAGSPRLLMFSSEGDPATAHAYSVISHLETPRQSRLISVDDEGQHALWNTGGSRCVDRIGDDFLFDGIMPRFDGVCGTVPLPGEQKVYPFVGGVVGGQHEAPRAQQG